jgi:predicted ATPase
MIKNISLKNFKIFNNKTEFNLSNFNLLTGINGRGKSSFLQSLLILRQTIEKSEKNIHKILFNGACVNLGAFEDIRNKKTSLDDSISIEIRLDKQVIEFDISQNSDDDMIGTLNNAKKISDILFLKNIHYIAADRIGPKEFYLRTALSDFINVGTRGENTSNVLLLKKDYVINSDLAIEKKEEEIATSSSLELEIQTGEWLSKILGSNTKVFIKNSENRHIISLVFEIDKSKDLLPTNVGFGYTYILPIIVTGLIAKKDEIIIIENPEAHLHPKAQHELTLFLAKVARTGVQIFVETHSEHILNAVRISTTKEQKILNNEEISILYFQDNNEQPVVKIPLLENGAIEEWPDGFFDQTEKDFNKLFEF